MTNVSAAPDRQATQMALRYAVRVLERQARWHDVLGKVLKFVSLMGATGACATFFASMGGGSGAVPWPAVLAGLVFAGAQALEVAISPAERRAEALFGRRDYARILAKAAGMDDAALAQAYDAAVAEDAVQPMLTLRRLAYNDVLEEFGLDRSAAYTVRWPGALLAGCS